MTLALILLIALLLELEINMTSTQYFSLLINIWAVGLIVSCKSRFALTVGLAVNCFLLAVYELLVPAINSSN